MSASLIPPLEIFFFLSPGDLIFFRKKTAVFLKLRRRFGGLKIQDELYKIRYFPEVEKCSRAGMVCRVIAQPLRGQGQSQGLTSRGLSATGFVWTGIQVPVFGGPPDLFCS